MIYLEQITETQTVQIPRTGRVPLGAVNLSIVGTVTLSPIFDALVTDNGSSDLYWTFVIALPSGAPRGEYRYHLVDSAGKTIADGLAVVGDYAPQVEEVPIQVRFDEYDAIRYEQ